MVAREDSERRAETCQEDDCDDDHAPGPLALAVRATTPRRHGGSERGRPAFGGQPGGTRRARGWVGRLPRAVADELGGFAPRVVPHLVTPEGIRLPTL